jgi:ribose 5-phosphate isomerase B
MKIAVGSDHAGFHLKGKVVSWLRERGIEVNDVGTHNDARCDYPDYAKAAAEKVSRGEADRGILVCGSGIGMVITANKFAGVRAAACFDPVSARLSRSHNDANVLCLGERMVSEETAQKIVESWLDTPFEGGRHALRVDKIKALERANFKISHA